MQLGGNLLESTDRNAVTHKMPKPTPSREPSPTACHQLVALFNEQRYAELEQQTASLLKHFGRSGFVWKVRGAALQAQGKDPMPALNAAAQLLPNDHETQNLLGNVKRSTGRLDEAVVCYRRALKLKPDFVEAHSNLGNVLRDLKLPDEAVTSLLRALELKPDFAGAHNNLGNAYRDLGQNEQAMASYRRALEIEPDYAEAQNNLGNALGNAGRHGEAISYFQAALKLKPLYAEAHNNMGNIMRDLGRLEDAVSCYQTALRIRSEFSGAHENLGNTFLALGRLSDAAASLQRALEIGPGSALTYNSLGNIQKDLGQPKEAILSYQKALAIDPHFAGAHSNLGNVLKDLGQLGAAAECYQTALKIQPDLPQALLNFGNILCDLDRLHEASSVYQRALAVDPERCGVDAAVSLAILCFLNGEHARSRTYLALARSADKVHGYAGKSTRHYIFFLEKLLDWHQKHAFVALNNDERREVLHVVGESHSLSANGVEVNYEGRPLQCKSEWIAGCKQWHLGNAVANRFKHKFESVLARLPLGSEVLLTIGEIDCRLDEGIASVLEKHPNRTLDEIVLTTTARYLQYAVAVAARYSHRIVVQGVPAPYIQASVQSTPEAKKLAKLISDFNARLRSGTNDLTLAFLDMHALTNRGDGFTNGEWHIDGTHLLPTAIAQAFETHCTRP